MGNTKKKFYTSNIYTSVCSETEFGYSGYVIIKDYTLKFKIKNVLVSLSEGDLNLTLEPLEEAVGIESKPLRFHFKARSDSNKESLARQLKSAFPDSEAQWILVVNELASSFIEALNNHKQLFTNSEISGQKKDWLLEPFLEEHSINIFFGLGSGGKTLTSIYLGVLYGLGRRVFDADAGSQGNVLLVDFENDAVEWRDRMRSLCGKMQVTMEDLENNFFYWQSDQIPMYAQVEKIKETIREKKIKLVIIDSASMAAGDTTSDESAALKLMGALKMLDTTVLLIAHQRKNDGDATPIGSIQYFNQARNIWHIEGRVDDKDNRIMHIGCIHSKCNNGYLRKNPIGFKVFFGEGYTDMHLEDATKYFDDKFTLSDRIKRSLRESPKGYKELAEELSITPKYASKELSRLRKRGEVDKDGENWVIK